MPTRHLVFDGAPHAAWLTACLALAVICLVLLFQYERRLIPQRLGWVLLGLRLAAAAVIFTALLEPKLTTSVSREQAARILVALDLSRSMDTADRSASSAEQLRLARALGMFHEQSALQLDQWIDACEQGREPEWVSEAESTDADAAATIAAGRKRLVEIACREAAGLPRNEIVRRILTQGQSPLLERLRELGAVELRVFAGKSMEMDVQRLEAVLRGPPESLDRESSDLTAPLDAATADGPPLTALILLTDGRDTTRHPPDQIVSRIGAAGAPVYAVALGSVHRARDLAILSVDAPATVYVEDHPVVRVELRTSGFEGQPVQVTLAPADKERAGTAAANSRVLQQTVTPQGESASVQFSLDARTVGRYRYEVRVQAVPGETRDDNNSRTFAVNVVDDRANVLVLEEEARWEFRYLEAVLQRDQRVQLDRVLFQQPYLGLLPDTFFPRVLPQHDPQAASTGGGRFARYDVVIVGDVSPRQLAVDIWDELDRYVREQGGTLVLIAGRRHMPRAYDSDVMRGLLPVERLEPIVADAAGDAASPHNRGFRLRLTPDGETAPALQLDDDPAGNRSVWSTLPGHAWGLRGRAKPGCTVWATAVRPDASDDLQSERASAVLVHQYLGAGQVVWIGIDSTWRWRYRVGDRYHHRFWGQLVRSAAEFQAAARSQSVQFGPAKPTIEAGQPAVFRAVWSEPFVRQHAQLQARVTLTRVEDDPQAPPAVTVELRPQPARPHVHEAAVDGLPPGEYRARLLVDGSAPLDEELSAEIQVLPKTTPELHELTANLPLLENIARATEGALLRPDQLRELPDRLRPVRSTESIQRETPLWNHWSLLLAFCCLVSTEWVLRKLNGLP